MHCRCCESIRHIGPGIVEGAAEDIELPDIVSDTIEAHMPERDSDSTIPKWDSTRVRYDDAKIRDRVLLPESEPYLIGAYVRITWQHDTLPISIRLIDTSICHGETIMDREVDILRPSIPARLCFHIFELLFLSMCYESPRLSEGDDLRSDDEDISLFEN